MNKVNKTEQAKKIFERFFEITPLCEGVQLSLKCKQHNCVVQLKPRKLLYYTDIPEFMCNICCNNDMLKKYNKIKYTAKKNNLELLSTRVDFLRNHEVTLNCKNNHTIISDCPVKYCSECYDKEFTTYVVKKKTGKKYNVEPTLYIHKDIIYICARNMSIKKIIDGIKLINNNDKIIKKFILDNDSFKNINLKKVYKQVEEDLPVEEVEEDLPVEEVEEDLPVEEVEEDLPVEEVEEDVTLKNKIISQEINYNFEKQEINQVFENPNENQENIDLEFNYEDILNAHNKHNKIMDDYYEKLEYNCPIFDNENDYNDYIIYKKSCNEKQQKLEKIIYEKSPRITNYVGNNITKEYVNHDSLNEYFKSLNTFFNKKDILKNLIYTPTPLIDIIDLSFNCEAYIKENDINLKKMEQCMAYIDTKEEEKLASKIIINCKKLFTQINNFYTKGEITNLKPILNVLKNLRSEETGLYEMVIIDLFSSKENSINIDPVLVNCILFAMPDKHYPIFSTYFFNNKDKIYTDFELNTYISLDGKNYLCSKRFIQKLCYIDSGVAKLFWKIILSENSLEKFSIDKNFSELLDYCPDTMFYLDNKTRCGFSTMSFKNYKINSYLDYRYNFIDFVISLFDNTKEFNYNKRSLLTRFLILVSSYGSSYHIKESLHDYLKYFMLTKNILLNEREKNILNDKSFEYKEKIITSEIKNMFNCQILNEKDCNFEGTILNPKNCMKS